MSKHSRVAVLRGGPSEEYDVSLQTGAAVIEALKARDYLPQDIVIAKNGDWITDGFVRSPYRALEAVDMVFVALHGTYGEDGTIQRLLARLHMPYLGSTAIPSATAFNKDLTKQMLREYDIQMPRHVLLSRKNLATLGRDLSEIQQYLGHKLVLKPTASGSSLGVIITDQPQRLLTFVTRLLSEHSHVMVEECIDGIEATCGVLEQFRDQSVYVLPPIEIVPAAGRRFFDYESKYDNSTKEICPGRFSYSEKAMLSEAAERIHNALGLTQISRSDFIVKDGEIYFLEVNTLPGLTKASLFPKAAAAVGLSYPDLIEHLVRTATP